MKWTLFARLGERLSRFARGSQRVAARRGSRVTPTEIAAEFTTEELAEFLEGDLHPNDARPEFREQLREDMWSLVQDLYGPGNRRD